MLLVMMIEVVDSIMISVVDLICSWVCSVSGRKIVKISVFYIYDYFFVVLIGKLVFCVV